MNEPVTFPLPFQQMMDSLYPHHITREICLLSSVILRPQSG